MNRRVHVMITREGWYYVGMLAFIIAGAVIRDINLLYIMAGMMLGPLLFSFYLSTRSLRRLTFRRRYQRLIAVGDPLFVEVIAEKANASSRSCAVVVRDRIRRDTNKWGGPRATARLLFPYIPSGHPIQASYRATLERRGRYRLGPLRVSTGVPLGLIRAFSVVPTEDEVLVSPQLGTLLPAWTRQIELRNEGGQKSVRRRGISEGEFYGMREYRDGDSRSWIHWRTSAKRNKLSVKQFEQRINQDLVVILDLWQPKVSREPLPDIERAISFAATLVTERGKYGASHLMVASASASHFILKGTSSPLFRQELMERLAMVEPTAEDRLPEVLRDALQQTARNAKVVLISTRDLDLNDTDYFATIWKHTDIRRLLSDIVKVNTASVEFASWFQPRHAESVIEQEQEMEVAPA